MAVAAPNNNNDVINWEEAMQQVGDDEEFLRELLADLRSETETQLGTITSIVQVG
jgi:HPt (histidine-containing phosphotransfer) domain-containing protein